MTFSPAASQRDSPNLTRCYQAALAATVSDSGKPPSLLIPTRLVPGETAYEDDKA